jgi:hypothetical protein
LGSEIARLLAFFMAVPASHETRAHSQFGRDHFENILPRKTLKS